MSNVKSWRQRAPDVANLFNPAFCAALINRVAAGYSATLSPGLPFPLAFVALPVLLHPESADALPSTARTNFHGWLLENPQVLIGFPERARAMTPLVREAISFGLNNEILLLNNLYVAQSSEKQIKRWEKEEYNVKYARNSQLLGKLLGQLPDVTTTFALFGIRP
jgi:hypothetical protein